MNVATLGIRVDATGAVRTLDTFDTRLAATAAKAEASTARMRSSFGSLKTIGGVAGVAFLTAALKKTVDETIEAQHAMAQLEAAVKSTGGAAGLTVRQLSDLSSSLQDVSTYSDEAVQGAQSILLTFTKIKGDQFVEATKAVVDLATRMKTDLKGAALQVGKALQDPEHGLTALRKAGVSFNQTQTEVIRKLYETGQEAKAQQLILAELTKEFGGSAAAARGTLGGALDGLKNSFGELFEMTEANTGATVRWINRLEDAFKWIKKIAERNVADFSDATSRTWGQLPDVTIHGRTPTAGEINDAQASARRRIIDAERKAVEQLTASLIELDLKWGQRDYGAGASFAIDQKLAGGMPKPEALPSGPTLTYQQRQQVEQWNHVLMGGLALPVKKAGDEINKMAEATKLAAKTIAQSISYFLVSKIGGGGVGASLGAGIGSSLTDKMSAFGVGLGPVGAVAGALVGKIIGGMFGSTGADREAARQAAAAQKDLAATMDLLRAKAQGLNTALLEQLEANRRNFEQIKLQINAALPGKKHEEERNRLRAEADALAAKEAVRIAADVALKKKQSDEDLRVRLLRAQGMSAEADAMAFALVQERELGQARREGASAAELATLAEVQKAEAQRRATDEEKRATEAANAATEAAKRAREEYAAQEKERVRFRDALIGRGLAATGQGRAAEDSRTALGQRTEWEEAVKAGMQPATLALLAFVQWAERQQIEMQRAIEDGTKAIETATRLQVEAIDRQLSAIQLASEAEQKSFELQISTASAAADAFQAALSGQIKSTKDLADAIVKSLSSQIDAIRKASAAEQKGYSVQIDTIRKASAAEQKAYSEQIDAIRKASAAEQKAYSEQIDAIRKASAAEQKAYSEQIATAKDALDVARSQLREQERTVEATRRVVESLTQFAAGLKLNTSLTTLSPISQLAEARRQYESLLGQANAGNRDAAGNLPGAAQSYLQASRAVNASSPGYVADFTRVQQTVAAITDRFGVQLSVEEKILKELQDQATTLEAQVTALEAAKEQARAASDAQIDALQSAKDEARAASDAQIEALQTAKDQAREISDAQLTVLQAAKDEARAASDIQIEALQTAKDEARAAADAQIEALQSAKDEARAASDIQIAALQAAKDQARAIADAQIVTLQAAKDQATKDSAEQIKKLTEQLTAQYQAALEASGYYKIWLNETKNDRDLATNYYKEALKYFEKIAADSAVTRENTRRMAPLLRIIPDPVLPTIWQGIADSNVELRTLVGVTVAAGVETRNEFRALRAELAMNTSETRLGFEGLRLMS